MTIYEDDDDDIFYEPIKKVEHDPLFGRCEKIWSAYCTLYNNPNSKGPLTDWEEVVALSKEYNCDVSFPIRVIFDVVRYYTLRSSTGGIVYRKQYAGKFLRSSWGRFMDQLVGTDCTVPLEHFSNIESWNLYMETETVFEMLKTRGVDMKDFTAPAVEEVILSWVLTCSAACRIAICPSDKVLKKFGIEFMKWLSELPMELREAAFEDISGLEIDTITKRIKEFEVEGTLELPPPEIKSRKGSAQ
jgi:hypothetical protein